MQPIVVERLLQRLTAQPDESDAEVKARRIASDNVAIIQQQYQAIGRGDGEEAVAFLADDIEMEIVCPPELPLVRTASGRPAASEAIRRNFSMLDDQRPVIERVAANGDTVVVLGRETGRVISTGREYEVQWEQRFLFRDGKIVRFYEIADSVAQVNAIRAG